MNLMIPMAALAAAFAAAAALQDEDPDLNRPYQWVQAETGCTALLDGPGPGGVGPITGLVETGMRDEVYLYLSAWSRGWPLRRGEQYALDIGFDGASPRVHVAEAGSHQDGMLTFDLDPAFRAGLRGTRSIEFYRDGRRVGAVSANGLAATIDAIEACAASPPVHADDATADMNASDMSVDMNMTDMNVTTDAETYSNAAAARR